MNERKGERGRGELKFFFYKRQTKQVRRKKDRKKAQSDSAKSRIYL